MSEVFARPYCPRCLRASGCDCGIGLIDLDGELIVEWNGRYDSLFVHYARRYGLDWRLVKAQAIAESSLNPRARSPAGAMGLMQFMPATWTEWGEGDPYDPEASIRAGCRYMSHLYGCYGEIPDDTERYKFALAAYNAGRGNINRALTLARGCSFAEWDAQGRPPGDWQTWRYASAYLPEVTGRHAVETLGYVSKIMGGNQS